MKMEVYEYKKCYQRMFQALVLHRLQTGQFALRCPHAPPLQTAMLSTFTEGSNPTRKLLISSGLQLLQHHAGVTLTQRLRLQALLVGAA